MNPDKWLEALDKNTEDFKQAFGQLAAEQLNWKPDEERWSIAQNIDHLITINESYFPHLEAIQNGTYQVPFTGKFGVLVNLFGKALLKSVQPDTRKKVKTFSIWEPAKSEIDSNIISRFEHHQSDLKQVISDSQKLLENGTVVSSPASKYVVYKLETAFDIIVAHEQRHFKQANEVLSEMRNGGHL
ncbi:MAG: DinB family protein [Balneolaceae bacterium]